MEQRPISPDVFRAARVAEPADREDGTAPGTDGGGYPFDDGVGPPPYAFEDLYGADGYRRRFDKPPTEPMSLDDVFHADVAEFAKKYDGYAFSMHESDGFFPMSDSLQSVRTSGNALSQQTDAQPIVPRHVNGSLWTE